MDEPLTQGRDPRKVGNEFDAFAVFLKKCALPIAGILFVLYLFGYS